MTPDKIYTAEQIVEWWKRCSMQFPGKDCGDCPIKDDCDAAYNEYGNCEDIFGRIACRSAELLNDALEREKERQWISVEDRMPESNTWVLTACMAVPEGIYCVPYVAELRNGKWYDQDDDEFEIISSLQVTHWMPLPEPPEEVTQDA